MNPEPYYPLPFHIISTGRFSPIADIIVATAGPTLASTAWGTNNRAIYAPVALPARFTVARFFAGNGADLTGNVDLGLYSEAGSLLLSTGATARAGSNVVQYVDATDTSFPAGRYYLACVLSSSAGTIRTTTLTTDTGKMCGMLQETLGGATLAATMTPVTYAPSGVVFCFGFTQSGTV